MLNFTPYWGVGLLGGGPTRGTGNSNTDCSRRQTAAKVRYIMTAVARQKVLEKPSAGVSSKLKSLNSIETYFKHYLIQK